jgi:hypothetical protein
MYVHECVCVFVCARVRVRVCVLCVVLCVYVLCVRARVCIVVND